MQEAFEIQVHPQEELERNLGAETPEEQEGFAVVSASGFAVVSASGFAVVSPSGFAVVSPSGFAVV